jgi:hypothetical protein
MPLQFADDGVDDVAMGALAAGHVDVRQRIGRPFFDREALECSLNARPRRLASRRPTVDLPTPIRPTRTIGRSRSWMSSCTLGAIQRWHSSGKSPSESPIAEAQHPTMSRIIVLVIVLALVVGGLFLLSTQADEVPTTTIETDVRPSADAR